MLDTAAGRGADLLKFGGDALLFLFRGDGHAVRACDAAVEMRSALREAATLPTSVGRLRLSMSVGVHSGDVHLFLVGEPTRELLVLGPAATATAEAEKARARGEIVVTAGTAARLPRGATRPREDGALLLRRRSASAPAPGAAPPAAVRQAVDCGPCSPRPGRLPGPRPAGPGAPGGHHRLRPVLRHRRDPGRRRAGRARGRHARDGPAGRGGPGCRGRHPALDRPRQRRRRVLPRPRASRSPARTTRAACCARCAGSRTRGLPLPLQVGRQPRPRVRRRGGHRRPGGVLGHGRHDQHRRAHRGHGSGRGRVRPPRRPGALAHDVRRHSRRAVPDEGQGRPAAGPRRRRGDRDA